MRKFNINVDGKNYVVEVEQIGGVAANTVVAAPVQAAPAAAPKAAPVAAGNGEPFKAPMPGTVLDVCVASGASVKKGDTILVLEAMKMENNMTAQKDGVVTVTVSKGASVASGDTLFTIA